MSTGTIKSSLYITDNCDYSSVQVKKIDLKRFIIDYFYQCEHMLDEKDVSALWNQIDHVVSPDRINDTGKKLIFIHREEESRKNERFFRGIILN